MSDLSHAMLRDAQGLGHEARVHSDDHAALKLWLRLLSCTTQIESVVRRRLRQRFGVSLARFDYLAQLYRYRDGLRMRDLSRHLMVTGGNVTGLTDELVREGLVMRRTSDTDKRSRIVCLTDKGLSAFESMAQAHEDWVLELLGNLTDKQLHQMYTQLGILRVHLMHHETSEEPT